MNAIKVDTSSPLKRDIIRRLKTVALVCEAPESATHGLLDALHKYGALLAVIGTREGFREVLETIAPLSDAVICAKRAIRYVCFVLCACNAAQYCRNHARCA